MHGRVDEDFRLQRGVGIALCAEPEGIGKPSTAHSLLWKEHHGGASVRSEALRPHTRTAPENRGAIPQALELYTGALELVLP